MSRVAIGRWMPLFREYEPMLVWLVRGADAVGESYRRRGERVRFGLRVEEAVELARGAFGRWPWGKLQLEYERAREAVGLFDVR